MIDGGREGREGYTNLERKIIDQISCLFSTLLKKVLLVKVRLVFGEEGSV